MLPPDHFFRHRLAPRHIDDEGSDQPAQVESSVESVGEGDQIGLAVLSVLQRVERVGQRGLQVAQHGVDPLELGQIHTERNRGIRMHSVKMAKSRLTVSEIFPNVTTCSGFSWLAYIANHGQNRLSAKLGSRRPQKVSSDQMQRPSRSSGELH